MRQQDRRADLVFFDDNHPGPDRCSGSYFPPLEMSSAGLQWLIDQHHHAFLGYQKQLGVLMTTGPDRMILSELGKHDTLMGNALHRYVIEKDSPRYEECRGIEITRVEKQISQIGKTIVGLRALMARLQRAHEHSVGILPIWHWNIEVENLLRLPDLDAKEVAVVIKELDSPLSKQTQTNHGS